MQTHNVVVRALIIPAFICTLLGGCAGGLSSAFSSRAPFTIGEDEIMIRAVLVAQATAWNRGDIPGFMEGYWKDDALRFASGGTVTRGWQATLDRYLGRYGTERKSMGTLSFSELEVEQTSRDTAIVHGRWRLDYADTSPNGLFTLVFRKIDGTWLIVSDTTTSAGE